MFCGALFHKYFVFQLFNLKEFLRQQSVLSVILLINVPLQEEKSLFKF